MWRDRYETDTLHASSKDMYIKPGMKKQIIIATAFFSCCQCLASESKSSAQRARFSGHTAFSENRQGLSAGQPHESKEYEDRNNEPEIGIVVECVFFSHKRSEEIEDALDSVLDPEAAGVDGEFCQGDKQNIGLDALKTLVICVEYFIVHLRQFAPSVKIDFIGKYILFCIRKQ